MKHFVIAAELMKSDADTLSELLQGASYAFWHYVENSWLVVVPQPGVQTAKELYDWILMSRPILAGKSMVILAIDDPKTFWGLSARPGWNWMQLSGFGNPG